MISILAIPKKKPDDYKGGPGFPPLFSVEKINKCIESERVSALLYYLFF